MPSECHPFIIHSTVRHIMELSEYVYSLIPLTKFCLLFLEPTGFLGYLAFQHLSTIKYLSKLLVESLFGAVKPNIWIYDVMFVT